MLLIPECGFLDFGMLSPFRSESRMQCLKLALEVFLIQGWQMVEGWLNIGRGEFLYFEGGGREW